jgi:hypothetical protein
VYALQAAGQGGALAFFAHQLEHADWIGFRFYDLIFPLFIFLALQRHFPKRTTDCTDRTDNFSPPLYGSCIRG